MIIFSLLVFLNAYCKVHAQQAHLHIAFKEGKVPQYLYITIDGQPTFQKYSSNGASNLDITIDNLPNPIKPNTKTSSFYTYAHLYYTNRPDLTRQSIRTLSPHKVDFVLENQVVISATGQVSGKLNNYFRKFALINQNFSDWERNYWVTHQGVGKEYILKLEEALNEKIKQILNTPNDSLAFDALSTISPKKLSDVNYNSLSRHFSPSFKANPKTAYLFKQLDEYKINTYNLSKLMFKNSDGKEVVYQSSAAKYTLIDFWATWCSPCILELPTVRNVQKNYQDKGLNVVFVSLDAHPEKWTNYISTSGMKTAYNYNLPEAFNSVLAKKLNIKAIPSNIIIDEAGNIIATNVHNAELTKKLDELLVKHEASK